ncbi:hypothetical protein [Desulfobacula toluolica]|uniref:Uncharacterized protein n=1 Tax=Desulfobacula toluolica (strain DSM 7467 / Tol2) TaxID=651182 RepID=K0NNU9_DESTT|nr:hypothetical protein [Desulfobacula toluolica]CCK80442.1 uncharacterized protein TOL2_C22810 [Desulfobacula toluolica Tol2]
MIEYALVIGNNFIKTFLAHLQVGTMPVTHFFARMGIFLSSKETLLVILAVLGVLVGMLFFPKRH